MKKILLILIGLSLVALANTNLEWQDNYSDNDDVIKTANWKGAIEYCNGLSLDGGGWRLPNKNELLSIVDYTRFNPSINIDTFKKTAWGYYWSSTTISGRRTTAWAIRFDGSGASNNPHDYGKSSNLHHVRCVRSKQ